MTQRLSEDDVKRLLTERTEEVRAETAHKLASQYGHAEMSESERAMAEEIFRIMVRDAAVRVRQALAEQLAESGVVPHDVALSLAQDIDEVALPVLQKSSVLTDEDLIEIVRASGTTKQVAIAQREAVSETVSAALVETADEDVVAELVANDGATLSEASLHKVIDDFGDSARIQQPMVSRGSLPVGISERLVSVLSDSLREQLVAKHELSPETATDLIIQSRERAILGLSKGSDIRDVMALTAQLHRNGRLTPTLILRATCMGDGQFLEASLATLCDIPLSNAQALIHDRGGLGLKSIYRHAKLPDEFYPAIKVAVDVMRETDYDGNDHDRERYRRRVVERILTQTEDIATEDLDYLLDRMSDMGMRAAA
ncbi:MAG: DUF2336 domain-containing protein [Alphaproteobacteria bacterium]